MSLRRVCVGLLACLSACGPGANFVTERQGKLVVAIDGYPETFDAERIEGLLEVGAECVTFRPEMGNAMTLIFPPGYTMAGVDRLVAGGAGEDEGRVEVVIDGTHELENTLSEPGCPERAIFFGSLTPVNGSGGLRPVANPMPPPTTG